MVFLKDLFDLEGFSGLSEEGVLHKSYLSVDNEDKLPVIIASYSGRNVGFVVDKLFQQKEIVEKALSQPIDRIDMISGATILGNGNVCLVLDIARIMDSVFKEQLIN